jgi:hypothetical protein
MLAFSQILFATYSAFGFPIPAWLFWAIFSLSAAYFLFVRFIKPKLNKSAGQNPVKLPDSTSDGSSKPKKVTEEQLGLYRDRQTILNIVGILSFILWILGILLSVKMLSYTKFENYGALIIVSFIALKAFNFIFWRKYFRCPVCGKPFPYFGDDANTCKNCGTNYDVAEDEADAAKKEAEEDKWV